MISVRWTAIRVFQTLDLLFSAPVQLSPGWAQARSPESVLLPDSRARRAQGRAPQHVRSSGRGPCPARGLTSSMSLAGELFAENAASLLVAGIANGSIGGRAIEPRY